jgi:D-glycero-alpha-D-manno-heptose 1-phosphate guanylyltransferase
MLKALILAGGFGSRLQSVVSDVPKPMAKVAGRPFLEWVLDYCLEAGIKETIISVGYLAEKITTHFKNEYKGLKIKYAVESSPLGTGGAMRFALDAEDPESDWLVLNGDTLFKCNIQKLYEFYKSTQADMLIALRRMHYFDRYGVVEIDKKGRILKFREKQFCTEGLINGGVYIFKAALLQKYFDNSVPFSFEKDFMEQYLSELYFFGLEQEGYFIDIGIPEDFEKANLELGVNK